MCVVHPTHLPHDWHNIGAEENDDIVSSNITRVCCCGRPPLLSHFGFFFLKRKNSFVFFISFRYHIIRPSFSLSLSYRYGIIIRRRLYQLKTYSSFSRHVWHSFAYECLYPYNERSCSYVIREEAYFSMHQKWIFLHHIFLIFFVERATALLVYKRSSSESSHSNDNWIWHGNSVDL